MGKNDKNEVILKGLIAEAKELYKGFYITKDEGNNAFNFSLRKDPKIFVAQLEEGLIDSIKIGEKIAFEDFDGYELKSCFGLDRFVFTRLDIFDYDSPASIFIFDNHNHAFFFWFLMKKTGYLDKKTICFHVDAHKDTRHPVHRFEDFCLQKGLNANDLNTAFIYTNEVLNVGSFIKPAQDIGIIDDLFIVDGEASMEEAMERIKSCDDCDVILDLDLDFFVSELDFLDNEKKIFLIKEILKKACVVTVASSPFFIGQEKALHWLKRIF